MSTLVLRAAAVFLMPLILLFSAFLLLRGHNESGGGFSGGLVAAAALTLYAIAHSPAAARRALRVNPQILMGSGILLALAAGVAGLLVGDPFLTAQWWGKLELGPDLSLALGTPLVFDLGIYLVVIGATVLVVIRFLEH